MDKEKKDKRGKNYVHSITQETNDRVTPIPQKTVCSGPEVMALNVTFNNISRRSVLLLEETKVPEKITYLL